MVKLTYEEVSELGQALQDIEGYLTDNSCTDPECCGGPYYTVEDVRNANVVLNKFGLEFVL